MRAAVRIERDRQLVGEVADRLASSARNVSDGIWRGIRCVSVKYVSLSCSVASQLQSRSASTASGTITPV